MMHICNEKIIAKIKTCFPESKTVTMIVDAMMALLVRMLKYSRALSMCCTATHVVIANEWHKR